MDCKQANSARGKQKKVSSIQLSLSIAENHSEEAVSVFPNPADDFVIINIPQGQDLPDSFSIYNTLGQRVIQTNVSNSNDLTLGIKTLLIYVSLPGSFTIDFFK